mmetsp:Transcript_87509/g.141706  ORF Transcript_87509/g.141706 Transcript_87509/m.141706 type:complete len:211 (-) Transcript_87509:294-926(-)
MKTFYKEETCKIFSRRFHTQSRCGDPTRFACACVYMCLGKCMCVCVYMCVCVRVSICTHTPTITHTLVSHSYQRRSSENAIEAIVGLGPPLPSSPTSSLLFLRVSTLASFPLAFPLPSPPASTHSPPPAAVRTPRLFGRIRAKMSSSSSSRSLLSKTSTPPPSTFFPSFASFPFSFRPEFRFVTQLSPSACASSVLLLLRRAMVALERSL